MTNTQTQHTPGPWTVEKSSLGEPHDLDVRGESYAVCVVLGGDDLNEDFAPELSSKGDKKEAKVERDANAALIAAAPEMLSVLRFVRDEIAWGHDMRASAAAIERIIQKAKGIK